MKGVGIRALALLLVLLPTLAMAQAANPPLSHTDPAALVAPAANASQPIARPETTPKAINGDDTPRFVLVSAVFDGIHAISADKLDTAWGPYRGKPVTLADLGAIARAAEAIYARNGYPFVAVVLNPQRVVDGAVRFKVVEGRITNLTILGADPQARRQAAAAFQPLVNRAPLAAADVEGAYERAKAAPGLTVAGGLHRGDVPGGMSLLVQARRQPWLVYANVNNLYPDALGPWGALLGVDHNGGSLYGDQTSAQVYESLDGGRQTVARLSHEQILNASGTALAVTALGAWADPGRDLAPLDLATNVEIGQIALSQPILARLARNLTATAAFEVDDQKTRVFSKVGLTDDRLRIVSLGLDGQWRFADGADLGVSAEVRQGLEVLGASRRGDLSLSRQGADPAATVGRITVLALSPRFHKVRLVVRVDGQVANAPLTAPEQYAVGNLTIGRGYQPGANFGDDALAGSAEVRLGPYMVMRRFSLEPFGFYDRVHIWTETPGAPMDRTLSSVGGGVRLETPNRLHVDLTYAVPLDPPLGLGEPTPHARLLVNVTVGLNDVFAALHRRLAPGVSQ
ncbi:MAG TPA: POTRA domain-containing protein [Caulobacteraceae bacterium]